MTSRVSDPRRLRVLVSASPGELPDERQAADSAVRTMRLAPVLSEPGADAPDGGSQIFVGIYWESYGWVAPEASTSALEDDYHRCGDRPRLVYVKEPAPARDFQLAQLVESMRAGGPTTLRTFATPGELAELLIEDLAALVSERFQKRSERRKLPEGTVTFLFVDIDGSTPLVQHLGDARFAEVLEPYRRVVTDSVVEHGGTVVHFEGDGGFCAFPSPVGAARAAVAVHNRLARHPWPEGVAVRARIGLHTGRAQRTADNYAGLEVHRAARIGAAANGGQTLVSAASSVLLEEEATEGWSLVELGTFALKGLDRAEPLLQLQAPGPQDELLPPRARGVSSVRLPTELTSLIGREAEIADVVSRLERHEVRLVTLTGPGGIGKSRLSVAAAGLAAAAYPDGVFFVPLVDATTPEQVVSQIAETLAVRAEGARPLLDTIEDRLAAERSLLVLDNFEQVVEARTVVADLLGRCPGTDVVVTSRIPLRLRGEYEYLVSPLDEQHAVQLFLDRAATTQPAWKPSGAELSQVAEICRKLDGLPLAIELAAARLRVLDTASLLDRLGSRLDLVGGSVPDLPDRQRTLTATIDWSYDLLDEADRSLFRRLAIFVGGWTAEAAEAVCCEGLGDVLAGLERLTEHSLVVSFRGATEPRMRMLETIREYARMRLIESGEADEVGARHDEYFDRFVRGLRPHFDGSRAPEVMVRLDEDWDNIAATIPWRLAARDYESLVTLATSTWRYIWLYDRVTEAQWMEVVYEARDELEPASRGELCRIWSSALYQLGEYERARAIMEEAVGVLVETGPRDREAWARALLGAVLPYFEPDHHRALDEVARAISIFRDERNDFGLATVLGISGTLEILHGRTEEGADQIAEALATAERVGLPSLIGASRALNAVAAIATGDTTLARHHLEEATRAPLYLEGTAVCLEAFAALSLAEGNGVSAATAFGCAEALRERTGIRMWPTIRMALEPVIEAVDAAGPDAQAARYEGRRMSPRDVFVQLGRPAVAAAA